jgi:ABC-type lipoprotein export system ATPase subunit
MSTDSSESVILAQGLTKYYQRGKVRVEALRGVNLKVPRGAFVVIVGPSGGGKSTLLHLLGGIDRPSAAIFLLKGNRWRLLVRQN